MSYNWIWPDVSGKTSARKAVQEGVVACCIIAALDVGVAIYAGVSQTTFASYGTSIWVDGVVFALIGWRLWKNSRVAGAAGLLAISLEAADKLLHHPRTFNLVTIVLFLGILNSVRGAFALHRLNEQDKLNGIVTTPQSLG